MAQKHAQKTYAFILQSRGLEQTGQMGQKFGGKWPEIAEGYERQQSIIADKLGKQQVSRDMLPSTGQAGTLLQLYT